MLAYVICCKKLPDYLKLLVDLTEMSIKYEPDPDKFMVYINEAEAARATLDCIKSYLVPRRCYLRTVSCEVTEEGKCIFGEQGTGLTTGTKSLLQRARNRHTYGGISIREGLVYYPRRKDSFVWVYGSSYCKLSDFMEKPDRDCTDKERMTKEILRKVLTI